MEKTHSSPNREVTLRKRRHIHEETTAQAGQIHHPARQTAGDSARILDLQRLIGNQATQRLLIARNTVVAEGLLTPAQVKDAIAYYRAQPSRYTSEIIKQIQTEMGTEPTGKMSDVDVQAVAERQTELNKTEKPILQVDGKAGPRTLPAIFKFGLSQDTEISSYADTAREMWKDRKDQNKSEEQVARELVDKVIKAQFEALKIPPVECDITDDVGGRGAFRSGDWKLLLDKRQFSDPKLRNLNALTSTIYHEAQHAEHDYRIAQMLALKRNRSPKQIHDEIGLKVEIAKDAADHKRDLTNMQAVIAEGWYDSLYGEAGLETRRRNNAELKAAHAERTAARDAFEKDPSAKNEERKLKAEARYNKAVEEHDDLPHENDPERLEAKVEELLGEIE